MSETAQDAAALDDDMIDLDPNDAIELGYDETTDTAEDPANDVDAGSDYVPEPVPGAKPVDPRMADLVIPSAEDEIDDESEEG